MVTDKELKDQLKTHFGFDNFKGNQEAIIKNVLAGKDTFVLMPTGGGKSLCYQLPALLMEGTAIVVSPLIALMKNQVDAMRAFSVDNGIAHYLNSSLTKSAVETVKADVSSGKTKLLYVAPESLAKEENIEFLKTVKVSFIAIDEAHCISEWGHDFRPEYRNIKPVVAQLGQQIGIIALTATATRKVQQDIQKCLNMADADVFMSSFNRENLFYEVRPKTDNIDKEIITLITREFSGQSGIIYCLSRKKVDELTETLKVNNISALAYHAGMESGTRSENQDLFLFKKVDVIVATIAFGMGIDKPDVRFVIHYDMSKSLEGYYQETGRAGRDGNPGRCIAFYSKKDLQKLEKFMQKKSPSEQEIGKQLLRETAEYAETSLCRRRVLLHYFGEEYTNDNCGKCDNCLKQNNQKSQVDAKGLLTSVLDTVNALNGKAAIDYVIDIVLGNSTNEIEENEHNELETFGEAKDSSEGTLSTVINQAVVEGYLEKDADDDNLISVTAEGNKFLKKPKAFKIADDDDDSADEDAEAPINSSSSDSFTVDPELYGLLKDLRKKVAQKNDCPPYVIFQDPSLEAMATVYPISIEELQNIPGVGAGKAKRYGEDFIKLIKKHVIENEIERPEDLRVRSVPNKSKLKVSIIQAIDRKIPLDDIAESKGLDFDELLTEIESIVESGTKINIDFFLAQIMDEERTNDIFDYFREESESDDINDAVEGLGGDYTEEEIRLVRIKFLSEMGN